MTPAELMVLRKQHGLTQAEFGAQLEPSVSRLTVSNWERGRFAIPHDLAARMAGLVPTAPTPKNNAKQDKEALRVYTLQRKHGQTHMAIIAMWHAGGFTPSIEAQTMILEAFPDITQTPPAKS